MTPRVGDVVKVIHKETSAQVLFEIGDVGVVTEVSTAYHHGKQVGWHAVTFPRYGDWDWLFDNEFEVVT